jgi:RHS repeat-associated protein
MKTVKETVIDNNCIKDISTPKKVIKDLEIIEPSREEWHIIFEEMFAKKVISYDRYEAKTEEETGLYYFNQRYYDPEIGRFLTHDPAGQYSNPYVYCANNPLTYIDENGEFAFLIPLLVAGGVSAGINAGIQIVAYGLQNDWNMSGFQMNWGSVGTSFLTGAATAGIGMAMGAAGIGFNVAGNAGWLEKAVAAGGNAALIGGAGGMVNNVANDRDIFDNILGNMATGFAVGFAASSAGSVMDSMANKQAGVQAVPKPDSKVFNSDGTLKPEVVRNHAKEIISGDKLSNKFVKTELIKDGSNLKDWSKFTTHHFSVRHTVNMPGYYRYQVHFYKNKVTEVINYNVDYKVKF